MALAGQLEASDAVGDSAAAFGRLGELEEVSGGAGLVGFCLGGGLAFAVAARTEPTALVSYYGSALPQLLDLAPQVTCPSLHHFGTADDYLPMDEVRTITEAVTADDRPAHVELYEGANHAFDNDDFFLHHPEASSAAWATTLAFLHHNLPVGEGPP
jgi:carboxymethylenebutenolidase